MDLPRALAPWGVYLDLFPYPESSQIGLVVERIDRILGSFDAVTADEQGEPEGYDGIDRRGNYERLLLSEWLLAEEVPDEFMRRAAAGEHTFLQLATSSPSERRKTIVLFDAGPMQLGAPRLVHMALLIVLARRADAAGTSLSWGILQRPSFLNDGVSEPGIRELLRSRCLEHVREEHLSSWAAALVEKESDLWVIGGDKKLALSEWQKFSRVIVEDVYDPEVSAVKMFVEQGLNRQRELTLNLPEPTASAKLLRNPFEMRLQPEEAGALKFSSKLFFSGNGKFFCGRVSHNILAVYQTPTQPLSEPIKPKIYRSPMGLPIIAAGIGQKSTVVLICARGNRRLEVEFIGGVNNQARFTVTLPLQISDESIKGAEISPAVFCADPQGERLLMVLNNLMVSFPCDQGNNCRAEIEDTHVTQFIPYKNSVIYRNSDQALMVMDLATSLKNIKEFSEKILDIKVGFGGQSVYRSAQANEFGIVAAQTSYGWIIDGGSISETVGPGGNVIGVVGVWSKASSGLIRLEDAARRSPIIVGADWQLNMPQLSSPLGSLAVNTYGAIVYTSQTGELIVYSPGEQGVLARSLNE